MNKIEQYNIKLRKSIEHMQLQQTLIILQWPTLHTPLMAKSLNELVLTSNMNLPKED